MLVVAIFAALFLPFLLSSSVGLLWTLSRRHLRVTDHAELIFFVLPFLVWVLLSMEVPRKVPSEDMDHIFLAPLVLGTAVSVFYVIRSFVTGSLGVWRAAWLCASFGVAAAIATWWFMPRAGA